MSNVKEDVFEKLHQKVDSNSEALARIEGKIDGIAQQKSSDWQSFGIIGAIIMALWNLITK